MSLRDRKVWVVGASRGIGAALATELCARGATVAVSARRREALEAVAGNRMTVVEADVTSQASVDTAADRVRTALGGIDMVVLNAGYWEQMNAAAWAREVFAQHVDVNLLGVSNTLGAVLPQMIEAGSGHVVGVASVAG